MAAPLDLDAYLERIGWTGAVPAPTLESLRRLLFAHMARIPFENLDVLLGRPVRLDLEGLTAKLVHARRGGYCFEHATLLACALEGFGFSPVRHSARVTLFVPRTAQARNHMFLTVPLPEGTFVADPEFGTLAPPFPVPLVDAASDPPDGATHWMARDGSYWILRVWQEDRIVDAWASTLEADNAADFEMANHYTATHPASPFRNRILLRALVDGGRVTVMNRDVTLTRGASRVSSVLADRAALRALLAAHFGFDLPEVLNLRVPSIPGWD